MRFVLERSDDISYRIYRHTLIGQKLRSRVYTCFAVNFRSNHELNFLDIVAGTRYNLRVRHIIKFIDYENHHEGRRLTENFTAKTSQQPQSHPQLLRGHIWPISSSDILAAQNEADQLRACVELAGVHRPRVKSYIRYVIPLVCVTSPQ
jgi:hypothetical protein